jgi:hypothetical protein
MRASASRCPSDRRNVGRRIGCATPTPRCTAQRRWGRGRFVYFEERMNVAALARLNLERELRKALGSQ